MVEGHGEGPGCRSVLDEVIAALDDDDFSDAGRIEQVVLGVGDALTEALDARVMSQAPSGCAHRRGSRHPAVAGDDPSRSRRVPGPPSSSPSAARLIMASPLQQLRERLSWRRMVAVGGVLGVLYVGVTFFQVLLAAGTDDRVEADAIVVLGAAQYDGEPSPVLAGRLDHAEKLWREGVAPIVVTTGSNLPGDRFTEGFAGYEYLRFAGIPDADLLVITDGASTWEQLAATARQLRLRDLDSVVLVSDPYHSLRLTQIANEVGLDASVSSTDGASSIRQLLRETAAVSLGRIVGYRRVDNWLEGVG